MRRRAAFSGSAERAIGYEFHWLASPDVCVFEERPDIGAPVAVRIIGRDAALLNKLHAGRFPMPPDQLAEALRSSIIERQLEVGGNGGLPCSIILAPLRERSDTTQGRSAQPCFTSLAWIRR